MKNIISGCDETKLRNAFDRFHRTRILVLGDIMLDQYIWGKVSRISPEAPVPVVEVQRETKMLGGAANVINNIAALGGKPMLCGVIGDDKRGPELLSLLEEAGLTTDGILVERGRPTSMKTRVVAHNQQVVRFDRENRKDMETKTRETLLAFVKEKASGVDAIIVSDYGKGVVSADLIKGLVHLRKSWDGIVAVDPKIGNFPLYKGVDVITPNHHEAGAYCGFEIIDQEDLMRAGRHILSTLACRAVLITQGERGMTLFERGGGHRHIHTTAKKVYDVTGAGDTVIAAFCLGLTSGLDMQSSAVLSNIAAGIVVGEVGTSTIKAEELKRAVCTLEWEER